MIEPTFVERVAAFILLAPLVIFSLLIVTNLALRIRRWAQRHDNTNAEIDAQTLMIENVHVHGDPTAPTAEYGAVNEAREKLERRR